MTFEQYLDEVEVEQRRYPHWRSGQTHFNVLYECRTDLSESIRASDVDPFYDNAVLPKFLEVVKSRW